MWFFKQDNPNSVLLVLCDIIIYEDVQINLHNCCLITAAEGVKDAAAPAGKSLHDI